MFFSGGVVVPGFCVGGPDPGPSNIDIVLITKKGWRGKLLITSKIIKNLK